MLSGKVRLFGGAVPNQPAVDALPNVDEEATGNNASSSDVCAACAPGIERKRGRRFRKVCVNQSQGCGDSGGKACAGKRVRLWREKKE